MSNNWISSSTSTFVLSCNQLEWYEFLWRERILYSLPGNRRAATLLRQVIMHTVSTWGGFIRKQYVGTQSLIYMIMMHVVAHCSRQMRYRYRLQPSHHSREAIKPGYDASLLCCLNEIRLDLKWGWLTTGLVCVIDKHGPSNDRVVNKKIHSCLMGNHDNKTTVFGM